MYIKAEYISHRKAYRLYINFQNTIAYAEYLEEAEKAAKELGYEGIILVE